MNLAQRLLSNDAQTVQENKIPVLTPVSNNGRFSEPEEITKASPEVVTEPSPEVKTEASPEVKTEASPEAITGKSPTATIIGNGSPTELENFIPELTAMEKRRNLLYAEMQVQISSIVMCALMQWITGEWGEENEGKYTPSTQKQKDLAKTIAEYNNLELKTRDPKSSMWGVMFALYAPIIFMAIQTAVRNKRNKKNKKPVLKVIKNVKKENITIEKKEIPETPSLSEKMLYKTIDENKTAIVKRPEKEKQDSTFIDETKTETRGRKKGSKKNPKTGKMEYPKIIDGFKVYSWGLKIKI